MMGRKNDGYVCPKCGEWDVRTEDYEMDIDCLWIKLHCPHCEETWSEYYTLTYDGTGNEKDENGNVTLDVELHLIGDINGDGAVNGKDAKNFVGIFKALLQ